jgi:hypothetical protein
VKEKFMNISTIIGLIIITFSVSIAQDVDELIEKIYQANQIQDADIDSLTNYKFKQKINFVKLDGDDEVDEQSMREYEVLVESDKERKRKLLSAKNYEDGEWREVTEEEGKKKNKSEGQEFSLNEIVGPEYREKYQFNIIGKETVNNYPAIHITVECLEEDDTMFGGDLWIHQDEYAVVKASLIPAEFPTGIEYMKMDLEMDQINGHWLPKQIHMDAEISFLFIFSGKIKSDILFYDYVFDVDLGDEIVNENTSDKVTK